MTKKTKKPVQREVDGQTVGVLLDAVELGKIDKIGHSLALKRAAVVRAIVRNYLGLGSALGAAAAANRCEARHHDGVTRCEKAPGHGGEHLGGMFVWTDRASTTISQSDPRIAAGGSDE